MCTTKDCLCSVSSTFWTTWIASFTIEFAVMFSKMSHGVLGVLRTDMALSKVCLIEFGYNETVCSDIKSYGDIEMDVQKRVNMFEMYGDIMTQVPTVIYALLAGSLSDKFGRGPLLLLPIIGQILEGVALLVNRIWFHELPLEALWLANIYDLMGGGAVWYLGVYSFAADITAAEDRASRMARFDGFEQLAFIVGNALSPMLFHLVGYQGAFVTKIALASISLMIVSRVLWNHKVKCCRQSMASLNSDPEKTSLYDKIKDILLGMGKTLFRKRANLLTFGILLQLLAYTMYYISFKSCSMLYLYVRFTLAWKQNEFIFLKIFRKCLGTAILLLLLPLMKKLKFSDANLLIGCNMLQGIGYFLASFATYHTGFLYFGYILVPFHYPKYPLARSLLSQSVEKNEVGRIFSCLSLLSALIPFFSRPLYSLMYNETMQTFPGTFLLFTSAIIFVAMTIMFGVKRIHKMQPPPQQCDFCVPMEGDEDKDLL